MISPKSSTSVLNERERERERVEACPKNRRYFVIIFLFFLCGVIVNVKSAHADITTGLLGHWAFEEGSGGTTADLSGNNHTGTLGGSPTWVSGRVDSGALQLDGVDDYVTPATASTLNANTYTISFWINGASGFTGTVFRLSNSSSNTNYLSKYETMVYSTGVTFRTGNGSSVADDDVFATTLTSGLWWHVACTLDGSNVKSCYRNGTLISSTANSADVTLNNPGVGLIGTNRPDSPLRNWYEGSLDDVRVYNRALSESDIQELYALGEDTSDPSVPSNLTPTSVFASSATFSWDASTDNVGVTGYNIYRNGVEQASTTNTTYTDSGLNVDTTYTYTVAAYDQAGNVSAQSASLQITTASRTFQVIQGGGGDYTTISGCVVDVQSGDICNVHAGTYAETVTATASGTYPYPIIIQANGVDVVNLGTTTLDQVNHVQIKNIKVKNIFHHGITWSFDDYYQVGLFANEDYWALGPVTITAMTPAYDGTLNGWQVNPAVSTEQGFDGRVGGFNASLVPSLPYTSTAPIESIVKTVSNAQSENSYIQTAAVLTVLSSVPEDNGSTVFRPPYMGTNKPFYTTSDLHTEYLLSLSPVGTPPSLTTVADRYEYLRLEHLTYNQRSFRPIDAYGETGTDGYGPQNSQYNADDILRLLLNDSLSDKMPALIGVTQHGIDQAHSVIGGLRTPGTGHDPGHSTMAAFGAVMLDITDAKNVLLVADDFEENDYTISGVGARGLWGGDNSESNYWLYVTAEDGNRANKDPYGFIDGGSLDRAGYQLILAQSYKGSVLVGSLISQISTSAWNPTEWSILSNYAERWEGTGFWTQPDPCAPYDGNPANEGITYGPDPANPGMCILDTDLSYYNSPTDFACQGGQQCGRFPTYHGTQTDEGQYKSTFVMAMWDAYYYPPTVSSLGPSSLVTGGYTNDTTPTLTFTLADTDSDPVAYELTVDDTSNFSSPVYQATSSYASSGAVSTTTGALSEGSYYWRVLVGDGTATSSYSTANSGSVAFTVDTTNPTPGDITFSSVTASSVTATTTATDANGLASPPFVYRNVTLDTYSEATSTSITFTGLSESTAYTYEVGVQDRAGNWATSTQYATTTLTAVTVPTLTTSSASSITATAATLNANLSATGGANPTQHGFAWGTASNLITGTATTTEGSKSGTGTFTSSLTSLTCNTTYYARAYATNSAGTGYGDIQSFTTSACPVAAVAETPAQTTSSSGSGYRSILNMGTTTLVPETENEENVAAGVVSRAAEIIGEIIPGFMRGDEGETLEIVVPRETPVSLKSDWDFVNTLAIRNFVLSPLPEQLTEIADKYPEINKMFAKLGISTVADLDRLRGMSIDLPDISNVKDLPTDVVIAQGANGKVPISSSVTVDEKGKVEQRVRAIANTSLTLAVKPGATASAVTGYLVFLKSGEGIVAEMPFNRQTASALTAIQVSPAAKPALPDRELLVQEFPYQDSDRDGVYTADITTPAVEGTYEVITMITYTDKTLGTKQLRLTTVIDPEGYVYEKIDGKEARIPEVSVSIFSAGTNALWDAVSYNQTNPQITNESGKYSFLVPEGRYYITAERNGYKPYKSDVFEVRKGSGVHFNIEMKSAGWFGGMDWKTAFLLMVIAVISSAFAGYALHEHALKRKLNKRYA